MMSPRGRAGGARDFCSSACLQSCSSVPEDPASLLIDGLAGKWPIKNFSPARARSAATCRSRLALELDARGNFSTSTETRKCPRGLSFRCPKPAADSLRISSTISSTTSGTGKSTICPQCAAESAPESENTICTICS